MSSEAPAPPPHAGGVAYEPGHVRQAAPPMPAGMPAADESAPMSMASAAPAEPSRAFSPGAAAKTARPESGSPVAVAPAGVRAGEWDDNANYRDFLGYLKNAQSLGIDRLDVSTRRFVVVQDKDGSGVPNCKVTISDPASQKTATLVTAASGRAVFFPRVAGMSGKLNASTTCLTQSKTSVDFETADADGAVKLQIGAARGDVSKPAVDVVFVLDTTGSMSEEIEGVKSTLKTVLSKLDPGVTIRVGLVEYKDQGDEFVTKTYALTSDVKSLAASIAKLSASGGGDTPEDVNSGLSVAVNQMSWSDKATARLAFLIADAPPHLDYANSTSYSASAKRAAEKGIKVFTVAASGMDALGQAVFRQVAQLTGGTNMFVLRGGAGPQSAGGGDPTSSCGAAHQNYSSGNLDQLITGKIALEITSLKADPTRIPGLGKDENAKACNERVLIVAR